MDITSFLIGKEVGGGSAPTPTYQDKEITITQNGEQTITADSGYDALSSVEITTNVPQPSGKITITENGTDIDVSSYATADVNVPAGADLSEYFNSTIGTGTNDIASWQKVIKKIPNLSVSGTSLEYAFSKIPNTFNIPVVNATNVKTFENCFYSANLTTIDLSSWIITDINGNISFATMFSSCKAEEINLSCLGSFSGNFQKNFRQMFQYCNKLKKLNLSNFDNSGHASKENIVTLNMFSGCTALEEIDFSSFDFSKISNTSKTSMFTGVPTNCLILVKDQTQKDWFTTNWSNLTNVQIKSEYIANQGA